MALVLSAVAVAGCGSGSPSASQTPDGKAIVALLTDHYAHPSCAQLTTHGRTAFGHPEADTACAADIARQKPDTVSVSDVKVDGDSATASATDSHRGKYQFDLLKVSGAWLIDGGHKP